MDTKYTFKYETADGDEVIVTRTDIDNVTQVANTFKAFLRGVTFSEVSIRHVFNEDEEEE